MSNNLEFIGWKTELAQSETFGDLYEKMLNDDQSAAFNSPLFKDVAEILNSILLNNTHLSAFQKDMLGVIFNAFQEIRKQIDPKRLKSFENYYNEDNELLLYRKTDKGLTNIIINSEDCIAYSFIGNDHKRILTFWYTGDDFEALAYDFFSN